ncbi:MAG: hypothetical protein NTZ40_02200 [Cyanobacteria bacterium]|nr:hypothetical protein [Cyanobacteriota bacterium]
MADSMVGSLCREVDGIRRRASQLLLAMRSCQDAALSQRLGLELSQLQQRRGELLRSARTWRNQSVVKDELALEFLIEIANRSPLTERWAH